jgi:hypothetical protein
VCDSWAKRVGLIATCVFMSIGGAFLLVKWASSAHAAPQAGGVELGPDHTQQAVAGQTVIYNHTLTNTGTMTHTFLLEVLSTQRWPVALLGGVYPTGTLILSLQVGGQTTTSFQVSLTVPPDTAGVTEITIITATSQLSPTVQATATDTTIVPYRVYLPLVLRRWPPIPYTPTLDPIDNADGDDNYIVRWTEQTLRLAYTYTLQEATDAAFTTGLRDVCTTEQQFCAVMDKPAGTYYYHVRGHNTWGYSAWSNVQTATVPYTCPITSSNQYSGGIVYQYDLDDPVRPAYDHADKNLELRGYIPNTDPNLQRELVDYGSDDPTQPPQLATLFNPPRVSDFSDFYTVHNWNWASPPDPGSRGGPITDYPVTALGMQTTPGETLYVPTSGYDIDGGIEAIVLFVDEDTIALRYTREDSAAPPGYTVHIDNICTDPNLLVLYNQLDDPNGPRYVYVPPENRPYSYGLPNLYAGQPLGTARSTEIVVAIVDTGAFMDARSCNEWWQIRPGYPGTCPPHE